jgi:aminopeptidase YwaD
MKKFCFVLFFAIYLIPGAIVAQKAEVQSDILEKHVQFLASDSLKGRKPGTPEIKVAGDYILQQMVEAGLTPMADDGFQYFDIVTGVSLGPDNVLALDDTPFVLDTDFTPLAFSSSGQVDAGMVFAGFGFDLDLDKLKWSDYQQIDPNGKWVIMFRGDPEPDNAESLFIPYSGIRSKVLTAKDKGAAGILLVTPGLMNKKDVLMPLVAESNDVTAGIPVVNITRSTADRLLGPTGYTADSLEKMIVEKMAPVAFAVPGSLSASVEVNQDREKAFNVVAMIEGNDPALKDEYLVVGAHYDHLGMGGPGTGSRMPDTNAVHNGADDNASGTAMVIELGRVMAANREALDRSIVFVAFSAEEMGLLGSKHFVDHPPVPLSSIKGMFNFDMVGRFDKEKNSISVSGTGTSKEADSLLKLYEKELPFKVVHAPDGYGPSDHAPFYAAEIPVFYFNTGVHTDYHTPFDDIEFLDFNTSATVGNFAGAMLLAVNTLPDGLSFQTSGSKTKSGRMGRRLKVTLGIMPDFAGTEKRGLRVDGVTKGKPADKGGMLKGDIIVSINGMKVENIYEYMARLSKLKAGQPINVEVIRGDEHQVLLIQL